MQELVTVLSATRLSVNNLIFFVLGLDPIQHLNVALNQWVEHCQPERVVLIKGELPGSCPVASESTGLPHVKSPGHWVTPHRMNPLHFGCSGDGCRS